MFFLPCDLVKSAKFPNKLARSTFFGIGVRNETELMVPETRTLLSVFTLENVCSSKAYLYSSPEYNRTHSALKSVKKVYYLLKVALFVFIIIITLSYSF